MDAIDAQIDLAETWRHGLEAARRRRRLLVLGATDVGKTSFIRLLLGVSGGARLIDLDPGQKMIGPPGTVGVGRLERLERFVFVGTTSAIAVSAIARASEALAEGAEPFFVNTSGFVKGPGARLQAMTAAAVRPDLIIEIGDEPILASPPAEVIRLERSALARRKTPAFRAAQRQAAFERELEGAALLALTNVETAPAAPLQWESSARPICALADRMGADMALGILEAADEDGLLVRARAPAEPVRLVRLGKMWAEPEEGHWRLDERLSPSWRTG
jgi:polynucleotide 5'-kinase involved in rRNA processing